MNKTLQISVLFAIMAIFFQNQASAGFYDWLISSDDSQADTLVTPTTPDTANISFQKVFSWDNRKPDSNNSSKNIIIADEPKDRFEVISTHNVRATGYSSTPDQTDSTPCIAASGYNICTGEENVIAANFSINGKRVPLGTLIRIPDLYGDKVFVIEDRMNSRYKNNIDIWFPERGLALQFGSQKLTIEVVALTDGSI